MGYYNPSKVKSSGLVDKSYSSHPDFSHGPRAKKEMHSPSTQKISGREDHNAVFIFLVRSFIECRENVQGTSNCEVFR